MPTPIKYATDEERKAAKAEASRLYRKNNPDKARAATAAWRAKNKNKAKELSTAWRKRNAARVRATKKSWRNANIEKEKERQRRWQDSNRDKVRAASNAWKKANKGKVSDYCAAKRAENPELFKKRLAEWKSKNKDRIKSYAVTYRKENEEAIKEWRRKDYSRNPGPKILREHNRRALKSVGGGTLSKDIIRILWKRQKGKCPACKADLRKTGFHLDHIFPLIPKKGEPAGKHEDKNVQLTCPTCNMKKKNKNPIQFMQEMGYLL